MNACPTIFWWGKKVLELRLGISKCACFLHSGYPGLSMTQPVGDNYKLQALKIVKSRIALALDLYWHHTLVMNFPLEPSLQLIRKACCGPRLCAPPSAPRASSPARCKAPSWWAPAGGSMVRWYPELAGSGWLHGFHPQ